MHPLLQLLPRFPQAIGTVRQAYDLCGDLSRVVRGDGAGVDLGDEQEVDCGAAAGSGVESCLCTKAGRYSRMT